MSIDPVKVFLFLKTENQNRYPDAINVGPEYVNFLLRKFQLLDPDDADITPSSAVAQSITHDNFKNEIMKRNVVEKLALADQMQTFQGYLDLIGIYIFASVEFAEQTLFFPDIMISSVIPYFETFQKDVKMNFMTIREKEQRFAFHQMRELFLEDGRPYMQNLRDYLTIKNPNSRYIMGLRMAHDTFGIYVSMLIGLQKGLLS